MLCRLESVSGNTKIYFELISMKDALKRMHKAKEEHREDFILFMKDEIKPFVEISGTKLYSEESVDEKGVSSSDSNNQGDGDRVRRTPRKRKKTLKKE